MRYLGKGLKPNPPLSPAWSTVKRPALVTKLVMGIGAVYSACFAGAGMMSYGLLHWLAFPSWPLEGFVIVGLVLGALGFGLGSRSAMRVIHASLAMPDDPV